MSGCYGSLATYVDVDSSGVDEIALDASYDPDNPFAEPPFDEQFWREVKKEKDSRGIDKLTAQRIVRVQRLKELCSGDLLIDLIKFKHDMYLSWCRKNNARDQFSTFVFMLTKFVKLILEEDFRAENPEYLQKQHEIPGDPEEDEDARYMILHLAAERNLTDIMDVILKKQPSLSNIGTYPDDNLPLWYALQGNHDEAASMLISHMPNHSVRDLFEDAENDYQFSKIIAHGEMKKTVEAVLDSCMNPDWPFTPSSGNGDGDEGVVLPDIPFRYHFFYRLLDGDMEGQPGKTDDGKINPEFNTNNSKSCLQLLAENSTPGDTSIRHPVVRMLMRSKWNNFGRFWIRMNLLLYVFFLSALSVAFLVEPSQPDRRRYETPLDYFRLFCEVVSLFFTVMFIYSEMDEVRKDKLAYFCDPFNYFDVLGLVLIIIVIPLRFTGSVAAEYGVSSAAYLINFLRIGKTATAFKSMSIYMKTFSQIITQEISKFLGVFTIFILSFSGAVFLALKASQVKMVNGSLQLANNTKGYGYVFLQELRSLAEANGFGETEEYTAMHVVVLILVMVNMFTCIVVLNNILIGQIGDSFAKSKEEAAIEYDIDRTKLVTRIEGKGFFCSTRLRAKHYVDAEFLSNVVLEADLLDDWIMLKQKAEDSNEKKEIIKGMMTMRKDASLMS